MSMRARPDIGCLQGSRLDHVLRVGRRQVESIDVPPLPGEIVDEVIRHSGQGSIWIRLVTDLDEKTQEMVHTASVIFDNPETVDDRAKAFLLDALKLAHESIFRWTWLSGALRQILIGTGHSPDKQGFDFGDGKHEPVVSGTTNDSILVKWKLSEGSTTTKRWFLVQSFIIAKWLARGLRETYEDNIKRQFRQAPPDLQKAMKWILAGIERLNAEQTENRTWFEYKRSPPQPPKDIRDHPPPPWVFEIDVAKEDAAHNQKLHELLGGVQTVLGHG